MNVKFNEDEVAVMQTALDCWGLGAQLAQTVEECAELIVALQKYINRSPSAEAVDNILGEIADVEIMLAQMRLVLGIDDIVLRKRMDEKFVKLKQYLEKSNVTKIN